MVPFGVRLCYSQTRQLYNSAIFFQFSWPKQCYWLQIYFLNRCTLSVHTSVREALLCTGQFSLFPLNREWSSWGSLISLCLAQGRSSAEEREYGKGYDLQRWDPYCGWLYPSSTSSTEIWTVLSTALGLVMFPSGGHQTLPSNIYLEQCKFNSN